MKEFILNRRERPLLILPDSCYPELPVEMREPTFKKGQPLPLVVRQREDMDNGGAHVYMLGECSVIITRDFGAEYHLSIANPARYPTWDEIAEARYRLLPEGITMVLCLPPMHEYINVHPNCFQLHQISNRRDIPSKVHLDHLKEEADRCGWPMPDIVARWEV